MAKADILNAGSRRDALVRSATTLFATRGYHGTRMDDVALAIGLTKATVYHYYASKSDILFDIYRHACDFTLNALDDDPSSTARETICQCTVRLLEGIAGDISRAAVYFQESPYIARWFSEDQVADIRARESRIFRRVRGVIDRGVAGGEFSDCDSLVLAHGYLGMTLGSYRWLRPLGRRPVQDVAVELSTTFMRGLICDQSIRDASPLGVPASLSSAR